MTPEDKNSSKENAPDNASRDLNQNANIKNINTKSKILYFVTYLLLLCLIAGIVFIILEKVGYLINHYYPNDYSIDSLSKDKIFLTLLTPVLLLINFLLLPLGLGEGGPYGHEGQQSGDSTALVILFTIFSFLYLYTRKKARDYLEIKKDKFRKFIAGSVLLYLILIFIVGIFTGIQLLNVSGIVISVLPFVITLILIFVFYLFDFLEIT